MRRLILAIIFVAALAAAGLAFLPATLVAGRIAALTQGKVRLADASGTLWQGRGTLGDAAGTWRVPLAWRIDPRDLVRGVRRVALEPVHPADTPRGTVTMRDDGFTAQNVAIDLPATALTMLLPPRTAPTLGGFLAVTSPRLALTGGVPDGTLDARWTGARLVLGDATANFGTMRLALQPKGKDLAGTLASEGGDVRLDGIVAYAAPALAVDVLLVPEPTAPAAVTRVLAAAGTPDGAGRVRLLWRGSVR